MIELKITAANPAELRQQVLDMQSVFSVSLAPAAAAPQQQLEVATPAPAFTAPAPAADEDGDGDAADINTPDSRGFKWDARIHSSNQKRVKKDNTWQYKRGVPVELIAQVEGEQKAPAPAPAAAAATVAPAPEVAPAPAPAAAATVVPASNAVTFPAVMNRFMLGVKNELLDQVGAVAKLREIAGMLGLPNAATYALPNMAQPDGATVLMMFSDYLTSVGC